MLLELMRHRSNVAGRAVEIWELVAGGTHRRRAKCLAFKIYISLRLIWLYPVARFRPGGLSDDLFGQPLYSVLIPTFLPKQVSRLLGTLSKLGSRWSI